MPNPDYDAIARRLASAINQAIIDQYARQNTGVRLLEREKALNESAIVEDLAQEIRLFLLAVIGRQHEINETQHEINKAVAQLTFWIEREFKTRISD
jgi:hypothetical protein